MEERQQHLEISKYITDWRKENVYCNSDLVEYNKKFRVEFSVFLQELRSSSFSPEIKEQYLK